jgi:hypothetical protein
MMKMKRTISIVLLSLFASLFQGVPTANANAGPATKLVLTQPAVGTASGAAFSTQPQITLQDASGNTVTGSALVVSVSRFIGYLHNGTGAEALIGTTTATVDATTGIATFPADFGISGIAGRTYSWRYSASGMTPATQSITVTPGVASKLIFKKASAGTTSGVAFTTQPQIALVDSGNNTITGSAPVITATISAGGTLVGTTTATVDSATGIATFTDLGISGTNNSSYTVTYSSAGVTAATVSIKVGTPTVPSAPNNNANSSTDNPSLFEFSFPAPNNGGSDITSYEYQWVTGPSAVTPSTWITYAAPEILSGLVTLSIDISLLVRAVAPDWNWFFVRSRNSVGASSAGCCVGYRIGGITPGPDVTAPTISSTNSSTSNGTYKAGDVISIQVNFSENVTVTGIPQLTLETGSTDRAVSYASGSGTNQLTFTYTVQVGDTAADLDYLSASALELNGGTIKDAAGNNAVLTLAAPGATNSLGANKAIVIDTTAPTVTLAASGPTSGSATVTFSVTGNEPITCSTLSTTSGTDFDLTGISAITGIVQTSATVCTITATSTATNGGGAVTSTLTAASTFSMTDTAGNAQTALTGSPQSTSVTIDTTAPTVTLAATAATSGSGTVTFTVTGNEPISCSTLSTVSGTDFTYTGITSLSGIVQTSPTVCTITAISTAALVGETATATITAAGSFSITDVTGNAQTTLTASPQSTSITVTDTTGPVLTLTSASALTSISANINFTSNEVGTYYYLIYAAADGPPDAATITAQGTSIAKGTSSAIAAANTANATGLSANTAYKAYVIVKDAATNTSAVSTIAFTTLAIVPGTPGAPTAVAGNGQAMVTVTPPSTGGTPTSYTVTSSPGGATCTVTGASGSCTVTGLNNGTPYTFTSIASNTGGPSISASAPSNSVTPVAPPAPVFFPEPAPAPVCDAACVAAQNAAAAKVVADRIAAEAKVVSDAAAKVVADKVVVDKTAAEAAAKTAVEKATAAVVAKAAADAAAVQAATIAKAAADAQAAAIDAANKAAAALKSATTTAAAKVAATATAAKAATTAANAVKAAATAAKTAATARATATNASKQVDIAIGALGSKTAAAATAAQANAIAAAAKAAANAAAKAATDQAAAAKVASNSANREAATTAASIATEQKQAADAAAEAKVASDVALKATEEKIAAATEAQKAAEAVVKALDEKIALAEASVKAKDVTERAAIDKKIEEITAKVAEAQKVADAANAKAAATAAAQETAQTAATTAAQNAATQAADTIAVRAESIAKNAVATKAAADASLAAKIATAAVAAAAKVPSRAVISAKPSSTTDKNSAKATISGLKPGQKVKVTVNVKGN